MFIMNVQINDIVLWKINFSIRSIFSMKETVAIIIIVNVVSSTESAID